MVLNEQEGPQFLRQIARNHNHGAREQILVTNGDATPHRDIFGIKMATDEEMLAKALSGPFDLVVTVCAGEVRFADGRSLELARDLLARGEPSVDTDDEFSAIAGRILKSRSGKLNAPLEPTEKVAQATALFTGSECSRALIVAQAGNLFPTDEADKILLDSLRAWRETTLKCDSALVVFTTRSVELLHAHLRADVGGAIVTKSSPTKAEFARVLHDLWMDNPYTLQLSEIEKYAEAATRHGISYRGLLSAFRKHDAENSRLSIETFKHCVPSEREGSEFLAPEKPNVTFADVAGLRLAKAEIRRRAILPLRYPEQARRLGLEPGGGMLLYGPPGTGKTMIAKAIANELGAPFFSVTIGDLLSKWYGESEQKAQQLFRAIGQSAEAHGMAVLFIDEVDGLLRNRDSADDEATQRFVAQFLTELDGFRSRGRMLLVAATNKPWLLDEAFMRPGRIDIEIHVPLPDFEARRALWKLHLRGRDHGKVDICFLVQRSEGFSGADIRGLCTKAAQRALDRVVRKSPKGKLLMSDLKHVLAKSSPSVAPETIRKYEEYSSRTRHD